MATETTSAPATALLSAYTSSNTMLLRNLRGIAEDHANNRPRSDMNNIVWVVGHIGYWRHEMANAAQIESSRDFADTSVFRGMTRGVLGDTTGWSLAEVTSLCESGLARMNEAFAAAAAGSSDTEGFIAMAGQLLVHEAYTVGQLAVLRRFAGYEGAL